MCKKGEDRKEIKINEHFIVYEKVGFFVIPLILKIFHTA